MLRIIQIGGVFDNQVLARLSTGLARARYVRCDHPLKANSWLPKETVGGFEFCPIGEGLRQSAAGFGGQMSCDIHQTLITTPIAQAGKSKLLLSPLCWRRKKANHQASVGTCAKSTSPKLLSYSNLCIRNS